MSSKWMSKLTSDFGVVASEISKTELPPIPTLSPSLNWALGIGGFKPGKISILAGPESGGKTMLAMMAVIQLQKQDKDAITVWFDAEYSFNASYFTKLGGDLSRVVYRKSNDPVKIFDYIGGELLEALQEGAPVKAVVVDSIRAIRFPKDVKKVSTDMIMGGTGANYLPSAFKMILPVIADYNLMSLFIQQVSIQIDPMKAMRNPYVIPDGQSLKHAADVLLEIVRLDTKNGVVENGETITGSAQQTGHKIRIKVKKNRMGAPARVAQFTLDYAKGVVDTGAEIFELAKSLNVVYHPTNPDTGKVNNQMWVFGNYPAIRGEDNMKNFVESNKNVQDEIMAACYGYVDAKVTLDATGSVVDEVEDTMVDI